MSEPSKEEFSLWPVINWLENGCDPKAAAVELRLYQKIMDRNQAIKNQNKPGDPNEIQK